MKKKIIAINKKNGDKYVLYNGEDEHTKRGRIITTLNMIWAKNYKIVLGGENANPNGNKSYN